MRLSKFRVQKYKSIDDSGWVATDTLTVLVGRNEAGKTNLLTALLKFNPFEVDPYNVDLEWPRSQRKSRTKSQEVCRCIFQLDNTEKEQLANFANTKISFDSIDVARLYDGSLKLYLSEKDFPLAIPQQEVDSIIKSLPQPDVDLKLRASFLSQLNKIRLELENLIKSGQYTAIDSSKKKHLSELSVEFPSPEIPIIDRVRNSELQFAEEFTNAYTSIAERIKEIETPRTKAIKFLTRNLPIFVYMADYKTFEGTALLDQVIERRARNCLTGADKTLLIIMELSGLTLDEEVEKGNRDEREQRQLDLKDASTELSRKIANRWNQRPCKVDFRADGQNFYTYVTDDNSDSLLKLEERSKGFQWFLSFDLMLMYESQGSFKNCVILLDEPGLHLHPKAQHDLLKRLEAYSESNTVIYTTHLPFMIDLDRPDRIRILNDTRDGTTVTDEFSSSQPEARFVLEAALGMSGRTSYIVARRNLVVERVDDYWLLTGLSNILIRDGQEGLPDDVLITPAGGASEAVYIATIMLGQELDVVVLLDQDEAGTIAKDKLVKNWLLKYRNKGIAHVVQLGEPLGKKGEFCIEDLLPEDYYLQYVKQVYLQELTVRGIDEISLPLSDSHSIYRRIKQFFEQHNLPFNKGSVAKLIRSDLNKASADTFPQTISYAKSLFASIRQRFTDSKK